MSCWRPERDKRAAVRVFYRHRPGPILTISTVMPSVSVKQFQLLQVSFGREVLVDQLRLA
jgi:hypothetical protein